MIRTDNMTAAGEHECGVRRLARAVDLCEDIAEARECRLERRSGDGRTSVTDIAQDALRDRGAPGRPPAASTSMAIIVGTTKLLVMRSWATRVRKPSGSNLRTVTLRAPRMKYASTFDPEPCAMAPMCAIASPGRASISSLSMLTVAATRPAMVDVAPLGRPVVPEV